MQEPIIINYSVGCYFKPFTFTHFILPTPREVVLFITLALTREGSWDSKGLGDSPKGTCLESSGAAH